MKEHPILFSGPMVHAILDGRKTQSRRVVKPQPRKPDAGFVLSSGQAYSPKCPYGVPGDRLWVRETWGILVKGMGFNAYEEPVYRVGYARDETIKWRPSIHMPRSACRINLEVTALRVERLQQINREDAKAEGITEYLGTFDYQPHTEHEFDVWRNRSTIDNFHHLWDSINAKRCFGWEANPWVWVIEFRRVE